MEHISANYPEEEWTQVYTDGSAFEATRDGGGGVYIKYKAEEAHILVGAVRYVTNFKAEAMALNTAATEDTNQPGQAPQESCFFFSDALSVLDALQNPKEIAK